MNYYIIKLTKYKRSIYFEKVIVIFLNVLLIATLFLVPNYEAQAQTQDSNNIVNYSIERPGGGQSYIVDPKQCRSVDRSSVSTNVSSAIVLLLTRNARITTAYAATVAQNIFADSISDNHLCAWTYRQYNPNDNRWHLYATIVNYTDSSFSKPIKTQNFKVGFY